MTTRMKFRIYRKVINRGRDAQLREIVDLFDHIADRLLIEAGDEPDIVVPGHCSFKATPEGQRPRHRHAAVYSSVRRPFDSPDNLDKSGFASAIAAKNCQLLARLN